ncbi:hypothetical protein L596_013885 [Steinernema carpocapsae]|uniref:TIL domain-containing protein n=1 Tax=Steinernema carpocapsae TaxID=34508 RepID=A0A4U5P2V4_STECR|nr:hypothetical protein L596_013885 [Steinernema carpocapsae]
MKFFFSVLALVVVVVVASARPAEEEAQKCGDNEVWRKCSGCESTCAERIKACALMCFPPKCQCEQGYLRDGLGECVLPEDCELTDPKPAIIMPSTPEDN